MARCRGARLASAVVLVAIAGFLPCPGQDFTLNAEPLVSIPLFDPDRLFSPGGGATLSGRVELLGFLSAGLDAGFLAAPARNTGETALLLSGGASVGGFLYPAPRLKLRGELFAGPYLGSWAGLGWSDLYWGARASLGYRFSPTFTLAGNASLTSWSPLFSGLSVGILADLSVGGGASRGSGIHFEESQDGAALPILFYRYGKTPLGTLRLRNREAAEIRDVEVRISVPGYGSQALLCGSFAMIPKGGEVELSILAALDEKVLGLTESTRLQAELQVAYRLLDAPREARKGFALAFEHRNAVDWKDARVIAAFASANDPAVLEFSKFVAGLVRTKARPEIDQNLQYAMGLFEGLRLTGLSWQVDPSTPYPLFHGGGVMDYVQYPFQTLSYKGGDSDDLGVLYASILESVGIQTALIPLGDDFLVAFSPSSSEQTARTWFSNPEDFIFEGGRAWIPIQVSAIREGFVRAWQGGARKWTEAGKGGAKPRLIVLSEAWGEFRPIGVPGIEARSAKPGEEQVSTAFENALRLFISRDIGPKVRKAQAEMGAGQGTGKQRNSLGILYARYGLLAEARQEFEKAVAAGFPSALTNLANVAFLQGDFETAARRFEEVLALQPTNKAALIGLARSRYELDAFEEADDLFSRARALDAAFADRYAYLSARGDAKGARASAAGDDGVMAWVEQEPGP